MPYFVNDYFYELWREGGHGVSISQAPARRDTHGCYRPRVVTVCLTTLVATCK